MHLAPGDPVDLFLGGGSGSAGGEGLSTDRRADADKTREDLRRQLGLDKPLHIQYLNWLSNIVMRVEDLDGFERSALMADSVLDQLVPTSSPVSIFLLLDMGFIFTAFPYFACFYV